MKCEIKKIITKSLRGSVYDLCLQSNSISTLSVHQKMMVAFKIIIGRVIDQMMILKATSFFYGHLMNT
jgi:hypothetical protein